MPTKTPPAQAAIESGARRCCVLTWVSKRVEMLAGRPVDELCAPAPRTPAVSVITAPLDLARVHLRPAQLTIAAERSAPRQPIFQGHDPVIAEARLGERLAPTQPQTEPVGREVAGPVVHRADEVCIVVVALVVVALEDQENGLGAPWCGEDVERHAQPSRPVETNDRKPSDCVGHITRRSPCCARGGVRAVQRRIGPRIDALPQRRQVMGPQPHGRIGQDHQLVFAGRGVAALDTTGIEGKAAGDDAVLDEDLGDVPEERLHDRADVFTVGRPDGRADIVQGVHWAEAAGHRLAVHKEAPISGCGRNREEPRRAVGDAQRGIEPKASPSKNTPRTIQFCSSIMVPYRPELVVPYRPELVVPYRPELVVPYRPELVVPYRPGLVVPYRPGLIDGMVFSVSPEAAQGAVLAGAGAGALPGKNGNGRRKRPRPTSAAESAMQVTPIRARSGPGRALKRKGTCSVA